MTHLSSVERHIWKNCPPWEANVDYPPERHPVPWRSSFGQLLPPQSGATEGSYLEDNHRELSVLQHHVCKDKDWLTLVKVAQQRGKQTSSCNHDLTKDSVTSDSTGEGWRISVLFGFKPHQHQRGSAWFVWLANMVCMATWLNGFFIDCFVVTCCINGRSEHLILLGPAAPRSW